MSVHLPSVALLVATLALAGPARAQVPAPSALPERSNVAVFADASRYLAAGVLAGVRPGSLTWGRGGLVLGAEVAAGRCAELCLQVVRNATSDDLDALPPEGLLNPSRMPGTPTLLLLPSARLAYQVGLASHGLFSDTDVYAVLLAGVAYAQARYATTAGSAPEDHRATAFTYGVGAGLRTRLGARFFTGLELRWRAGSAIFMPVGAGERQRLRLAGPTLALSAGLRF